MCVTLPNLIKIGLTVAEIEIFTLGGSNDADSRKDVPFGGFVDIAPHFRGEIPENTNFWGVNRRFQAKRAKY